MVLPVNIAYCKLPGNRRYKADLADINAGGGILRRQAKTGYNKKTKYDQNLCVLIKKINRPFKCNT